LQLILDQKLGALFEILELLADTNDAQALAVIADLAQAVVYNQTGEEVRLAVCTSMALAGAGIRQPSSWVSLS
jgi:hypothetical protein